MDRCQPGGLRGAGALSHRTVGTARLVNGERRAARHLQPVPTVRLLVTGLALCTAAAAATAEPVNYRFDPTHTSIHFELTHFGTSTIRGRFGPINGDATLD